MKIEGDEAKRFKVVRLDSYADAHRGELVRADDETGFFEYRDTPETTKQMTLGQHTIRIVPKK